MSEQTYTFRAMNTQIDLHLIPHQMQATCESLFADIRALFEQVENTCSRFRPDSELSQVNESPEQDIAVSPLLYDILTDALDAYEQTDGIFNPGLLAHLEAAGYDRSIELVTDSEDAPLLAETDSLRTAPFLLDRLHKTVRLRTGAKLDLGGIAKGWTVDRAAAYLQQHGVGFVNAGGDLRVFGTEEKPWQIGVEDPFDPDHDIGVFTIQSGAVATSSTWKRRWQRGGAIQNHLIDPRTGRPTKSELISATVLAPTAKQADVWAKTVLLLGVEAGTIFLKKQGTQAVLVDQNHQIRSVSS